MLVISGIFLFTSRNIGYLGNLIKGIFSNLLKGIWDIGNPPVQASIFEKLLAQDIHIWNIKIQGPAKKQASMTRKCHNHRPPKASQGRDTDNPQLHDSKNTI